MLLPYRWFKFHPAVWTKSMQNHEKKLLASTCLKIVDYKLFEKCWMAWVSTVNKCMPGFFFSITTATAIFPYPSSSVCLLKYFVFPSFHFYAKINKFRFNDNSEYTKEIVITVKRPTCCIFICPFSEQNKSVLLLLPHFLGAKRSLCQHFLKL